MKNLLKRGGAIAFAIIISAISVHAQNINKYVAGFSTTLVITSAATTNLVNPTYFDCAGSQYMALSSRGTASANGTLLGEVFAPSVDGINMDTNHTITVYGPTLAITTAGQFGAYTTNILVGAYKGFFLIAVTNTTSALVTNTISEGQKFNAP